MLFPSTQTCVLRSARQLTTSTSLLTGFVYWSGISRLCFCPHRSSLVVWSRQALRQIVRLFKRSNLKRTCMSFPIPGEKQLIDSAVTRSFAHGSALRDVDASIFLQRSAFASNELETRVTSFMQFLRLAYNSSFRVYFRLSFRCSASELASFRRVWEEKILFRALHRFERLVCRRHFCSTVLGLSGARFPNYSGDSSTQGDRLTFLLTASTGCEVNRPARWISALNSSMTMRGTPRRSLSPRMNSTRPWTKGRPLTLYLEGRWDKNRKCYVTFRPPELLQA